MQMLKQIAIFFLLTLVLTLGLHWWGNSRYKQGVVDAEQKAKVESQKLSDQYREQERTNQEKADKEYAEAKKREDALAAINNRLDAAAAGLRNKITLYERRMPETSDGTSAISIKGKVWLDLLAECSDQYRDMAKEAGRLADKVTALQGFTSILTATDVDIDVDPAVPVDGS